MNGAMAIGRLCLMVAIFTAVIYISGFFPAETRLEPVVLPFGRYYILLGSLITMFVLTLVLGFLYRSGTSVNLGKMVIAYFRMNRKLWPVIFLLIFTGWLKASSYWAFLFMQIVFSMAGMFLGMVYYKTQTISFTEQKKEAKQEHSKDIFLYARNAAVVLLLGIGSLCLVDFLLGTEGATLFLVPDFISEDFRDPGNTAMWSFVVILGLTLWDDIVLGYQRYLELFRPHFVFVFFMAFLYLLALHLFTHDYLGAVVNPGNAYAITLKNMTIGFFIAMVLIEANVINIGEL